MDKPMRIWTDEESLEVSHDTEDLIKAMRFKAKNIKAKADPELFEEVANHLERFVKISEKYISMLD